MMYEVVVTGGKSFLVTEDQKKKLEALMLEKEGGSQVCVLGKNTIRVSTIKGIFESGKTNFASSNRSFDRENREWDDLCKKMSLWSIEAKVDNEIDSRILPLFPVGSIDQETMSVVRQTIEAFFKTNTLYPRCPSTLWWPIVKDKATKVTTKMMVYVILNDDVIRQWVKNHKAK